LFQPTEQNQTCRAIFFLYPNFRPKKIGGRGFNLTSYVWGVACELREALKGLIEENQSE